MADNTESVSMVDVLEDDAALEEEANAVLGGSDENNCTYPEGYIDRQALYSCQTCTMKDHKDIAGICLACSLHCHDGHDLVELYTKRNFRCDCGNSKFTEHTCKLVKEKDVENSQNVYNHNFSGLYCTCNKIYPDPSDEVEDEMIQCVVCEDWYHSRHLGALSPVEFQEMICDGCMGRLDFLLCYTKDHDASKLRADEADVDVLSTADSKQVEKCKLEEFHLSKDKVKTKRVATFWKDDWRQDLCHCGKCKDMYASLGVSFLTIESDTVVAYERKGQSKAADKGTVYDNAMQALDGMERTQKVEVLHEFNTMKDELNDYLKKFAEDGRVVKKEDIDDFFSQLKARKRPRLELPQHCR